MADSELEFEVRIGKPTDYDPKSWRNERNRRTPCQRGCTVHIVHVQYIQAVGGPQNHHALVKPDLLVHGADAVGMSRRCRYKFYSEVHNIEGQLFTPSSLRPLRKPGSTRGNDQQRVLQLRVLCIERNG